MLDHLAPQTVRTPHDRGSWLRVAANDIGVDVPATQPAAERVLDVLEVIERPDRREAEESGYQEHDLLGHVPILGLRDSCNRIVANRNKFPRELVYWSKRCVPGLLRCNKTRTKRTSTPQLETFR